MTKVRKRKVRHPNGTTPSYFPFFLSKRFPQFHPVTQKLVLLGLIFAFSPCYTQWGAVYSAFIWEIQAEIFSKIPDDPAMLFYPLLLSGLIGKWFGPRCLGFPAQKKYFGSDPIIVGDGRHFLLTRRHFGTLSMDCSPGSPILGLKFAFFGKSPEHPKC